MNRPVVMIVEHRGDHYSATFPDYHSMGAIQANDASTLHRAGVAALQEEMARRKRYGAGMKAPRTLASHVFDHLDLRGKFLTVVEVEFA